MERAGGVVCPVVGCNILVNGFLLIPSHILEEHGFRVSEKRNEGYSCKVCMAPFQTYKGWKKHSEIHVNLPADPAAPNNPANNLPPPQAVENPDGNPPEANEGRLLGHNRNLEDAQNEIEGHNVINPEEYEGNLMVQLLNVEEEEEEERDLDFESLETLPNGKKDIKHAVARMIVNMRCVPAMTRVGVQRGMLGAELILKANNIRLKEEVKSYLASINRENSQQAQDLLKKFENTSPFEGMKSNMGQISAIEKYYYFIKPKTLRVGERYDRRLGDEGVYSQVPVTNTFEYVSPIDICKLIRQKTVIHDYVTSRRPSEDGILYGYTDGERYRDSDFFREYPDAYQLVLYYDGVGATRPLGPKKFEVGNFLLSILNVPPGINCTLAGIHPVVLANVEDCKETFEDVLYRLRDDLISLENGVRMWLKEGFAEIRGGLVGVKGDNKAVHEILGFLGCGANLFCTLCMITRDQLHSGEVILGERRTEEQFKHHLRQVNRNKTFSSACGLKYRTVLHDLKQFHAVNNQCFDLMHDAAEGVTMMLIRLCVKDLVCRVEPLFTCKDLNLRIGAYNFGKQNARDMPTPNFSEDSLATADKNHKQLSNAGQTMTLHRVLPFLLDNIGADDIPEDHGPSQMLILLSKIHEIASAHQIPKNIIPYLRRLLETFHKTWYVVFPTVNPINKCHNLQHIPDNILAMGPQRQFWCFREEAKNCPIKRHISVTNNFINACKTTMEQAQIFQAKVWGTMSNDIQTEVTYVKRRFVTVFDLPIPALMQCLGFAADHVLLVAEAVTSNGYEFRVGEFLLCVKASDLGEKSTPHQFGKILSVICPDDSDNIWFAVQAWSNCGLVQRFNAYKIAPYEDAPIHLIDRRDLPLHPPISRWRDYSSDGVYLSLKHAVF